MAEVLLARLSGADGFQREVVIKRVLPEFVADRGFIDMFRDEAHITAQLRHGNIVQVLEFQEEAGQYWLVLEYVDGAALNELVKSLADDGRTLPRSVTVHLLVEVARALDYAHRKRGADGQPLGVIHRDVSTSNVLVSRDGEVKLADFGIARAASRISTTATGGMKGKLRYMSPEMLLGEPDQRSDLFALGVVAWELFVGQAPFEADSIPGRMHKILHQELEPLANFAPDLPHELSALVDRLLSKQPENRPARAAEIVDAMGALAFTGPQPAADALAELVAWHVARAPRPEPTPPPVRTRTAASRPRALVVERSPTARALLCSTLRPLVDVVDVSDAAAARDALAKAPITLVLSQQLPMGAESGIALCSELRTASGNAELPFLLVASDPSPELEQEARAAGITAVVSKADRGALADAVKRVLDSA